MLKIGCHLSCSKGHLAMGREAVRLGANTFQFFTRNPRGGKAKELDLVDIAAYQAFAQEHSLFPPLAHAPYTLNLCGADSRVAEFAFETMRDDLNRLAHLPGVMYNFHPGSHVGQGPEVGIDKIAAQLNAILTPEQSTVILLEAMAGKGSEVGKTFEELRAILDRVTLSEKMGICLDTCHVSDGGYRLAEDLDSVLEEFDRIIGLSRLKAIHLNDSMNPVGSHKDRHEKIGKGHIGTDAFCRIINHPALRELPFYLETPNEAEGYAQEIALLKSLYRNDAGLF